MLVRGFTRRIQRSLCEPGFVYPRRRISQIKAIVTRRQRRCGSGGCGALEQHSRDCRIRGVVPAEGVEWSVGACPHGKGESKGLGGTQIEIRVGASDRKS